MPEIPTSRLRSCGTCVRRSRICVKAEARSGITVSHGLKEAILAALLRVHDRDQDRGRIHRVCLPGREAESQFGVTEARGRRHRKAAKQAKVAARVQRGERNG